MKNSKQSPGPSGPNQFSGKAPTLYKAAPGIQGKIKNQNKGKGT